MTNALSALKSLAARTLPLSVVLPLKKAWWAKNLAASVAAGEPEFAIVRKLVREGDDVVDVGANLGLYTALLSECVGDEGSVTSLEPIPVTFELLASNVRANDLVNVRLLPFAASDEVADRTMSVPTYDAGHDNYYMARLGPVSGEDAPRFQVRCRPLDRLLGDHTRRVAFIKIDVEGHEEACLRGADALLRRDHPALLVEVAGDPNDPSNGAHRVFRHLAALGYAAFQLVDGVLHPFAAGDRGLNWFFLMPEHVSRLVD